MKKPVLVVMAAGMGSRYGGLKQIDPVDNQGHIIMDFSIYDAVKAGFEKVIFIIKKENEADFKAAIGDRLSKVIHVEYVFQDLNNLPEGFAVPEGRVKPWGTGHAILSCLGTIDAPFAVINADDYYGSHAFKMIYDYLTTHEDDGSTWVTIPEGSTVSMNMWGFTESILKELQAHFSNFLNENLEKNPLKCEYFLPFVVDELLKENKATVQVLKSLDKWYGVTYKEDKPVVVAAIQNLKAQGLYPEKLWEEK